MLKYIEDALLSRLQRRCDHPGEMVAVDILEGGGGDVEVAYCRRCGAVKPEYEAARGLPTSWYRPNPHLWRG